MVINTTRFGQVEVEEQRLIHFPKGLLGFSRYTRFALMLPEENSYFYWLQSTEAADLAFVVTDPRLFVPTYRVPLDSEQIQSLGIESEEDAEVFIIVNKRGNLLTGNLQGPLVVRVATRVGEQMVLSDRRFTTRVPLLELPSPVKAMSA